MFLGIRRRHYIDFADGDDIDDLVLYDLAASDGEMVAFYLEKTTQEGLDALKAVPMKMSVGQTPRNAMFAWPSEEQWDFETDIPATRVLQ